MKKKKCTAVTTGTISNVKVKGLDFPTMITVMYEVDGKSYEIRESLKYKIKIVKFGFFPIGQKNVPIMGNTAVGNLARVSYEPGNPANAYLTDNIGIINV